jgi:hypothetical protein
MNKKWPDGTPKSENNAFTLGWGDTPHGFEPGPAKETAVRKNTRTPGGFARHNGTLHGLGRRPGNFTINKNRRTAA